MNTQTEKLEISSLLIGSDAEFFLKNKENNEIVSAENIVKGSKYAPFYFDPEDKFYTTSLDCVLAEVTIPPASSEGQFYLNIRKAMRYLEETIPQNLVLEAIPAARLDEKYLQSEVSRTFGKS